MSDFIVHSIPGSPFGRAVLATLMEKGAPFTFRAVGPRDLKAPSHLSRHPFGRVPVLQHGDYWLYETQAILRYLDRVLQNPPLTPSSPQQAGRMDQSMNVCDWYLFQGVANVIGFQRVVGPKLMGLTPDEGAIADAMPRAHQVFAELSRLLGSGSYFAGSAVSLADLMLAPQIDFFLGLPEWEPLVADKPNLTTWLDRMRSRPSMISTTWEAVAAMAA